MSDDLEPGYVADLGDGERQWDGMTDGPGCCCCSRIYRPDPPNAEQPGVARYRWTAQNGSVALLCMRCCALWREHAVEDSSLEPRHITEITPYDWGPPADRWSA